MKYIKEEENPNIKYRKRPGAYAIMTRNEDDKVGIVTDGRDLFYLGGGIEEGETKLQALKREFIEETGYTIKNIKPFDEVRSFVDSEEKGPLEVEAYIYTAEFDEKVADPIEKDHKVLWINPEDYMDKMYREWQKYILREYVERKKQNKGEIKVKIAIIERLEKYEEDKPFSIRYYLDSFYREIFDKLDILLIPIISEIHLDEICDMCDGLILTGSANDVHPKYYNEEPIKERTYDKFDEYPLVKKAVKMFNLNNKPILGICAGVQELNVIFGGTLNQMIPNHQLKKEQEMHKIKIEKNSFLFNVYNKEYIEVNSYHSQSINKLAPNFRITAKSEDGTIEAIENGNIIGVQWHPEALYDVQFFDKFIKKFVNGHKLF